MKKLSIFLLTSLIALGLLCTSNTNAMSYTVHGTATSVAIPANTSNGVKIDWGDDTTPTNVSDCPQVDLPATSTTFKQCEHSYLEDIDHSVTITNENNEMVIHIYLNNANITAVNNFEGFYDLNTIYLEHNKISEIDNNVVYGLSNVVIYLNYNEITDFTASLNNIKYLYLTHNQLTTIPDTIRGYYGTKLIKLSDTVQYGTNGGKFIDLSDNPINFIKILGYPDSTDTTYEFQRFAYSNSGYTQFDYGTDFTTTGTTTATSANITNIKNGSHHFTVCYSDDNSACNTVQFTTDLPSFLRIISPDSTYSLESATQVFSREGEDHYMSGFCYEFTKDGGGYTPIQACPTNDTSFTAYHLSDGNYTLKLSMRDADNEILGEEIVEHYNVNLYRYVIITRAPGNKITTKNYRFSRNGGADDFVKYTYLLTGDSYPTTGGDTTSTSFDAQNLKDGHYKLTVTIEGDGGSNLDIREFDVDINRDLELETSLLGNNITLNNITGTDVTIYRTGSSERFDRYTYELKRNNEYYSGGSSTQLIDSVLYRRLPSGTYDFTIKMYDEDDELITSNNTSFIINIPSNLTINSPTAGTQPNNITFDRNGFAENFDHYEYILERTDGGSYRKTGTGNQSFTQFSLTGLHHGNYTFTVNINDAASNVITGKNVSFSISDDVALTSKITSNNKVITQGGTADSKTATFSWEGRSEDFAGYYYSIVGTTNSYNYTGKTLGEREGSVTLYDLSTGQYRFTVKMLDSDGNEITSNTTEFNVVIPASLEITSPTNGTTITSSSATFTWTGFADTITKYDYELTGQPIQSTTSNSFTTNTLKNGSYTFTVWLYSGGNPVVQDSISFTVDIPAKSSGGGGSSGKTHYNNNLKLSLSNESPAVNEWIKLLVKIDDKYTGKVSFPKLQHYSSETEKWEDIPVTSKNYVSDYSDDAKLGYIKFSSDDNGRKSLSEFIKFSKNGYYRIYAEDKDGYDTYIEFKVSNAGNTKTTQQTVSNTAGSGATTSNNIDSIIQRYIPDVLPEDTSEEVYIARSCKKYTIKYSESLNVYTSPNLNMSEYFINKDYFKRYVDSKNKYQSGCPTNVGWISTNYSDKTNDNTRYTAPNGKVYFITGQDGNYYSDELNKELKTPTSFKTIQELKYYIRDRNPLISMAALGPTK